MRRAGWPFETVVCSLLRRAAPAILGFLGVSSGSALADGVLAAEFTAEPPAGPATVLHYDAFLAGVKVGEALIRLHIGEDRYQVSGSATAQGVLERFSGWRNRFRSEGALTDTGVEPVRFSYVEEDRNKHREVVVKHDTLQVTKNGKVRPPRPVPAGRDVLAGLFVRPHCQGDQRLHTGRHGYRLTRLASEPGRCRYMVIDDDDDRHEVDVVFSRRDGLVVPGRFVFQGVLTGSVELREPAPSDSGGGGAPVDP